MDTYYAVAIVTLLSGFTCFGMAITVARTHSRTGILAPRMTGDPQLERAVRAHSNTLEWMPIFLPAMWLFAFYWSPLWASILGAVWIVGRLIYFAGYLAAPEKRFPGFFIQTVAALALGLGALGRLIYLAAA
ncbi:MAPEG family protein [Enhydrobacter aerosaccus]|uniref:MAPEG family protein n=1 Tax=Enhydrobacter aerosaccus TaxID=225324 RepID=A0A1T4PN09_9HYPH|nr:MAPEG family protein [Enhydrobacter aerosaccus]SJZ92741.1 MAPEG family protein [Enhydrobacter aerosaccus]